MPADRKPPTLAQLIRRSPVLDAPARRHWLAVLPHLTDDDRDRLRVILLGAGERDLTPLPAARRKYRLRRHPLRRGEGEQGSPL